MLTIWHNLSPHFDNPCNQLLFICLKKKVASRYFRHKPQKKEEKKTTLHLLLLYIFRAFICILRSLPSPSLPLSFSLFLSPSLPPSLPSPSTWRNSFPLHWTKHAQEKNKLLVFIQYFPLHSHPSSGSEREREREREREKKKKIVVSMTMEGLRPSIFCEGIDPKV